MSTEDKEQRNEPGVTEWTPGSGDSSGRGAGAPPLNKAPVRNQSAAALLNADLVRSGKTPNKQQYIMCANSYSKE